MVRCRRTWAETGIIRTEIGSIRLVILMINYASAERLRWRWRRSWICDTERNNITLLSGVTVVLPWCHNHVTLPHHHNHHDNDNDGTHCLCLPAPTAPTTPATSAMSMTWPAGFFLNPPLLVSFHCIFIYSTDSHLQVQQQQHWHHHHPPPTNVMPTPA